MEVEYIHRPACECSCVVPVKFIDIKQSGNILDLQESEPALVTFAPGVTWKEIHAQSPGLELIDPATADNQHGIVVNAPGCTIRNHRSEHQEVPLSWYGKADRFKVVGARYSFCRTPICGVAAETRGANYVDIAGVVVEDMEPLGDTGVHIQNGSYCKYQIKGIRGSSLFTLYQTIENGVVMPCQYNTIWLDAEDINRVPGRPDARVFDFGGDGKIVDGEKHKGNKLYFTMKNCTSSLRFKSRKSNNPWYYKGTFDNCPNPIEFPGLYYRSDVHDLRPL